MKKTTTALVWSTMVIQNYGSRGTNLQTPSHCITSWARTCRRCPCGSRWATGRAGPRASRRQAAPNGSGPASGPARGTKCTAGWPWWRHRASGAPSSWAGCSGALGRWSGTGCIGSVGTSVGTTRVHSRLKHQRFIAEKTSFFHLVYCKCNCNCYACKQSYFSQ